MPIKVVCTQKVWSSTVLRFSLCCIENQWHSKISMCITLGDCKYSIGVVAFVK